MVTGIRYRKFHLRPVTRPDTVVDRPFLATVVPGPYVVWIVCLILSERIGNALVEDFVFHRIRRH
jgi:hypothetical protein